MYIKNNDCSSPVFQIPVDQIESFALSPILKEDEHAAVGFQQFSQAVPFDLLSRSKRELESNIDDLTNKQRRPSQKKESRKGTFHLDRGEMSREELKPHEN